MSFFKLYSDGGARGNPGPAGCGFVLFDEERLVGFDAKYLGVSTNNQAEYQGLILGLKFAIKNNFKSLNCFLDSELIVKQLNGLYKVKNENIKPFFDDVTSLIKYFEEIKFVHIERSLNSFADKLANIAMDASSFN